MMIYIMADINLIKTTLPPVIILYEVPWYLKCFPVIYTFSFFEQEKLKEELIKNFCVTWGISGFLQR